MASQADQDRYRAQIERLLGSPGVGPLAGAAIAVNLGVAAGALDALLAALERDGRIAATGDGRFTLPPAGRD